MSISAVLAVVRCLYVSLSVIHLHYVKTAEDIVTLFVGLVGPTFYFLSPFGVTKFQRNTLSVGVLSTRGWEKFAIFAHCLAIFWK